jgi:hypothetical protein
MKVIDLQKEVRMYISESENDTNSDTTSHMDNNSLEYSEDSNTDTTSSIYSLPFTSMIKFKENETIWCIKTESLFTYLQN